MPNQPEPVRVVILSELPVLFDTPAVSLAGYLIELGPTQNGEIVAIHLLEHRVSADSRPSARVLRFQLVDVQEIPHE